MKVKRASKAGTSMYEMAAIDIDIKFKVGPRTYSRVIHRVKTEECTQSELMRRAIDMYLHHLDEREMQLVSLMQAHADRSE